MGAAITRWVAAGVRALPAPLHRALDAWAQRQAAKRRRRRTLLMLQRQPR